jgi:hypothetical protein
MVGYPKVGRFAQHLGQAHGYLVQPAQLSCHKRLQAMRFQIQFCYFFYFPAFNLPRMHVLVATTSSESVDFSPFGE